MVILGVTKMLRDTVPIANKGICKVNGGFKRLAVLNLDSIPPYLVGIQIYDLVFPF